MTTFYLIILRMCGAIIHVAGRRLIKKLQVSIGAVHCISHLRANMAERGDSSEEDEEPTIADDVVVTKYKMAGDMANSMLEQL